MSKVSVLATLTPASMRLMGISQYSEAELKSIDLECINLLRKWVVKVDVAMSKGWGLYLWGKPFAGKSYIAAAILKAVARRRVGVCRFVPVTELRQLLTDFSKRAADPQFHKKYEELRTANVLVIDSLGSEKVTDFYLSELKAVLIARRSQQGCVTLFTSTFDPSPRTQRYLAAHYDEEVKDLIFGLAHPIEVKGGDFRGKAAAEMEKFFA